MSEYGGVDMKLAKSGGHAMAENSKQGGNKAAPRGGAGRSIDGHTLVDSLHNGCESVMVKNPLAMNEMPVVGRR
jgi:hypothetical protein